jgi:hypothetical protein
LNEEHLTQQAQGWGGLKAQAQKKSSKVHYLLELSHEDNTEQHNARVVNQHPPVHHPLDASYFSVMDEPQMS